MPVVLVLVVDWLVNIAYTGVKVHSTACPVHLTIYLLALYILPFM